MEPWSHGVMEAWGYRLVRVCSDHSYRGAHGLTKRYLVAPCGKTPVRRVGGPEGARKHSPAFGWATPKTRRP